MRGRGRIRAVAPVLLLGVAACADLVLPPEPADDPEAVARAAWSEADEYYAFFDRKGIDWDDVGERYLPTVGPQTTDAELFATLSAMIAELRDGHSGLITPLGRSFYDAWFTGRPENYFPELIDPYLTTPLRSGARGAVGWATLQGGIGYLRIASFGRSGTGAAVDLALESLRDVPGIIIDVRSNGGGSDLESEAAAGRFFDRRTHYRTYRYKVGPAHNDFGPAVADHIEPAGERRYRGPVVVLQNRRTYSATESFLLAMRVRPDVTFVGDTTGGGSGNPMGRELPNGWLLKISRWQEWAADGTWVEGVGLPPDTTVTISETDRGQGRDTILERALEILGGS